MAKKVYIGVNDVACEVKKMYIGIEGIAKKVTKAYIGDESGKARLVYSSNMFNITYTFVDVNSAGDNFNLALNYLTFLPDSAEAGEWMYDVFFADALAGSQWGDYSPYGISPTTESPLFGIVDSIEVAYINGENFYWSLPDGGEELGNVPMPESDITVGVWVYANANGGISDFYNIRNDTTGMTLSAPSWARVGEVVNITITEIEDTASSDFASIWVEGEDSGHDYGSASNISRLDLPYSISFTMPNENIVIGGNSE